MFKVEIHTKEEKVIALQVEKLETFTNAMSKNEILWLDGGMKGIYIPPSEIAQILFERLAGSESKQTCGDIQCSEACTLEEVLKYQHSDGAGCSDVSCYDPEAEARAAACQHQQQHIEG